MATYRILFWKEIPTQIKYNDDFNTSKSYKLDDFFQQAVDSIAMFDGSINSDEYLNAWSWGVETETNFKPEEIVDNYNSCLLYTSPSPRDGLLSRMPSSA